MYPGIHPTEDELATILRLRKELMSWDKIAETIGRSRYWVAGVVKTPELRQSLHSLKFPPKEKPDSVRQGAGRDPLPAGHPIAMRELERARWINLED
jgi:hypothetical protein